MSSTRAFVFIALLLLATTAAAQSETYCTSYANVSTGDTMQFNLDNIAYHVVQNFITPDYAGITINGVSYTVYPNAAHTINQNTGAYVEMTQINYIPSIQSINFILCSAQQTTDTQYNFNLSANSYGDLYFASYGTKLDVIAQVPISQASTNFPTNVTISNVTTSTPPPPSGYVKLTALSASVTTSANTTLNITQSVPCYVTPKTVAVYALVSGSWVLVSGDTFNSTACTVTAPIPTSSAVGIFYSSSGSTTSTASSTSTTTAGASSTTTQPTSSIPTTVRTTTSTPTTSRYSTAYSTTRTSTLSTSIYTSPTSISIPPQTSVPANSVYQIPANWIRYAILGAIALLVVYLLYLILHKNTA